mgnify:CR=1 FL=1
MQKILFGGNLVARIALGLVLGLVMAQFFPALAQQLGFLGQFFVRALRSIAPMLVFMLVLSAIANKQVGSSNQGLKEVLGLYLLGTVAAALVAVILSSTFPSTMKFVELKEAISPPQDVGEVLRGLILSVVDNPFNALMNANFIGVLFWAVCLGLSLRAAHPSSKQFISDMTDGVSFVVRVVIGFAPVGVFGLVAQTFAEYGLESLKDYFHLLAVLLAAMLLVMFVLNPLLVYWKIRKNPFPLVWLCVRESGLTAFFTRSSAANIPVNMALAKRLKFDPELVAVSIPLGATINMAGAAITITVLTLAAVNSLHIPVDFSTALLLTLVASICACGASGVGSGSLLLIPLACSLFKIPNEIAAQVIGVGFTINIIQDSAETALNSSTDVVFTGAVSLARGQGEL